MTASIADDHFDSLETRDPDARDQAIFGLLPDIISRAKATAPGWARQLADVPAREITSRERLATLPVLRKADLKSRQAETPPFGGFATAAPGEMQRMYMSPGPIFEPEGRGADWWRSARTLYAAGFRKGDVVHNTFSYHLTPGGWILEAGARALGCAVFPAGPGNTEQQLDAIQFIQPNAYIGVPDYLKILLDKANDVGREITCFKRAFVSGGPLFASLRGEYNERGIAVSQAYATADLGMVAYETAALDGMGTGDLVPVGDVGEIVVTTLNRDYPMFRLATGDLSARLPGMSPCGRTNMRIKGWMGRADQTTKIKGMFVHPEQIAEIGKRLPELGRLRLIVGRHAERDTMTLRAEAPSIDDGLAERVAAALQDLTKMRGDVELVEAGTLPNDGKVIADERDFDG